VDVIQYIYNIARRTSRTNVKEYGKRLESTKFRRRTPPGREVDKKDKAYGTHMQLYICTTRTKKLYHSCRVELVRGADQQPYQEHLTFPNWGRANQGVWPKGEYGRLPLRADQFCMLDKYGQWFSICINHKNIHTGVMIPVIHHWCSVMSTGVMRYWIPITR